MNAQTFLSRPLPEHFSAGTTASYHSIPVRIDHELSADPIVDAASYGLACASYYARTDRLNPPYHHVVAGSLKKVWCRKTVAEKLVGINKNLEAIGVEVLLLDGYRTIVCQRALWDFFEAIGRKQLGTPTEDELTKFVRRFISDPRPFKEADFHTWPTHATGGAIDLTLRARSSGEWLYMGGVFDDPSEVSYTRHYEGGANETMSLLEARKNRRLLYWSMIEAGFSNYTYEWWHYDFGNQLWVMSREGLQGEVGEREAFYGLALSGVAPSGD